MSITSPDAGGNESIRIIKDRKAVLWAEKMITEGTKPSSIVGDFIAKGAEILNMTTSDRSWKPVEITPSGEPESKMVLFTGNRENYRAPRFSSAILNAGLRLKLTTSFSPFVKSEAVIMFPYPRFQFDSNEVDPSDSVIMIINEKQYGDLEKILGTEKK